ILARQEDRHVHLLDRRRGADRRDPLQRRHAQWHDRAVVYDSGQRPRAAAKSEAPYVDSKPHGVKRSWYRSGRAQLEVRYERGGLREAQAWTEAGSPLADADARALAARELSEDEALYAALDALVEDHRPRCD